ncbi:hypothetical protein [Streptosporangium lutulentum]|uniref:Uncharacterized protein n=1 Tax=Streptosporangium lutulentum TaxID=1461250 RepID=A0ABT9QA72_9ACTN|nr:hypothetical protein [Streptosporangium lutulentum]MDP9843290.1 hypothetical protein [Streptosporangium lutulentum]
MFRNTTPTNQLIIEASEAYALTLAVLSIPVGVAVAITRANKPVVILNHDVSCEGVEHALRYYSEGIASPLVEAFEAAHALSECTQDRLIAGGVPNGPIEIVNRAEIKRLHKILLSTEETIRREIVKEFLAGLS